MASNSAIIPMIAATRGSVGSEDDTESSGTRRVRRSDHQPLMTEIPSITMLARKSKTSTATRLSVTHKGRGAPLSILGHRSGSNGDAPTEIAIDCGRCPMTLRKRVAKL